LERTWQVLVLTGKMCTVPKHRRSTPCCLLIHRAISGKSERAAGRGRGLPASDSQGQTSTAWPCALYFLQHSPERLCDAEVPDAYTGTAQGREETGGPCRGRGSGDRPLAPAGPRALSHSPAPVHAGRRAAG